jgi:hypothetical protein
LLRFRAKIIDLARKKRKELNIRLYLPEENEVKVERVCQKNVEMLESSPRINRTPIINGNKPTIQIDKIKPNTSIIIQKSNSNPINISFKGMAETKDEKMNI